MTGRVFSFSRVLNLLFILVAHHLLTLAAAASPLQFATTPDAPLHMQATKMSFFEMRGEAFLKQGAILQQGDLSLKSDKMHIVFGGPDKDVAEKIYVKGAVELIDAKGQRATAAHGVYDIASEKITLRDKVVVYDTSPNSQLDKLHGTILNINMRDGRGQLDGDGTARARIHLKPQVKP